VLKYGHTCSQHHERVMPQRRGTSLEVLKRLLRRARLAVARRGTGAYCSRAKMRNAHDAQSAQKAGMSPRKSRLVHAASGECAICVSIATTEPMASDLPSSQMRALLANEWGATDSPA